MAFDSSLNNAFPPSLIPHQKKMTLPSNYLSFNGGGAGDSDTFAQQYLPELYEAEVEKDIARYNTEIGKSRKFEEANFARMQGSLARQQARSAELGYYGQAGMSLLRGFGEV